MQKAVIEIQVNIEVMFSTPNKIDFAKEPSVTGVSKASVIAENYKNMFQLFLKKKEIKSQN